MARLDIHFGWFFRHLPPAAFPIRRFLSLFIIFYNLDVKNIVIVKCWQDYVSTANRLGSL